MVINNNLLLNYGKNRTASTTQNIVTLPMAYTEEFSTFIQVENVTYLGISQVKSTTLSTINVIAGQSTSQGAVTRDNVSFTYLTIGY